MKLLSTLRVEINQQLRYFQILKFELGDSSSKLHFKAEIEIPIIISNNSISIFHDWNKH